jgi:GNAT superfamily N-acetyltransferase
MILDGCTLSSYNKSTAAFCNAFDCGHDDLNEFFAKDAINYSDQLLGKTYCFTLDKEPKVIVAAFTVSNDSIKTTHLTSGPKARVQKKIPRVKTLRSYPAVLIGRLGVNKFFSGKGLGGEVMDFIKAWFIDGQNKTGCRYIVVDAYNEVKPIGFYKKNGLELLFSTEEQERDYLKLPDNTILKTRLMYFDLIIIR